MRVCFLSFKPSLVLQCKGAGRVMSGCSCAQGCMFLFGCKGWKCSGSSPKNPLARRKASKSGSVSLDLCTRSQNWLNLFFRVGTCFMANLSVHGLQDGTMALYASNAFRGFEGTRMLCSSMNWADPFQHEPLLPSEMWYPHNPHKPC